MDPNHAPEDAPPPMEEPQEAPPQNLPPNDSPKKSFGSNPNDWAMLTHLLGLCVVLGIPSFVGPLVLWLIKKNELPIVDRAGKEALNFHLTMLIVIIASIPLTFVIIGFLTLPAAVLMTIIFSVIAGLEANKGNDYSYPLSIRFIK